MDSRSATDAWRRLCAAALFAAHAAGSPVSAQSVRVVSSESLQTATPVNHSHTVRLSLYRFEGTRWAADDIRAAVAGAAQLLAQCGVAVAAARLHALSAPRSFHYYSAAVSRRLVPMLGASLPAVFFVEDTLNDPAFDAEAIGHANAGTRPELANTVWVAWGTRDLPVTLAHELVHVLSDSGGHSDEPGNLMRPETASGNTRLSAVQCERIRERGQSSGLLDRRARQD